MFQMIVKRHKVSTHASCLLSCVGMMHFPASSTAFAAETEGTRTQDYDSLGFSERSDGPSTVIREPGSAEDADDLKELNIGNNFFQTIGTLVQQFNFVIIQR